MNDRLTISLNRAPATIFKSMTYNNKIE